MMTDCKHWRIFMLPKIVLVDKSIWAAPRFGRWHRLQVQTAQQGSARTWRTTSAQLKHSLKSQ